jgi:hypothetical protein
MYGSKQWQKRLCVPKMLSNGNWECELLTSGNLRWQRNKRIPVVKDFSIQTSISFGDFPVPGLSLRTCRGVKSTPPVWMFLGVCVRTIH